MLPLHAGNLGHRNSPDHQIRVPKTYSEKLCLSIQALCAKKHWSCVPLALRERGSRGNGRGRLLP